MIYDLKTNNKSFLKMAIEIGKKGVRNNKFMLTLYDESLAGVDAHSKDLTMSQKAAIIQETHINIWYYLREVVRIPVSGQMVPYIANLGNMALTYLRLKNKNITMVLPRQHGKTVGNVLIDSWFMMFSARNSLILYLNKEGANSKQSLKIFKDIRENLPTYIRQVVEDRKDRDNIEEKHISSRNNTLRAMNAANSDEQADKIGRGLSSPLIYFDEMAFMARAKIIYEAAQPAFSAASAFAKANGSPHGLVITTTPNAWDVVDTPGHYTKTTKIDSAAKFEYFCYDMSDEELDDYIYKNSGNNFIHIEYTWKQLGKSDEWYEMQKRELNSPLAVARELDLFWPFSSDRSLFSEPDLNRIQHFVREPINRLSINGFILELYEKPDFNMNYIFSVDMAGGLGSDYTVIMMIAPDDFRVVGVLSNSRIDTDQTRVVINELLTTYFPNGILLVERNSFGKNIVDHFMKIPHIENRMYREKRMQAGTKTISGGYQVKRKSETWEYGVHTDKKSRDLMIELLPDIVQNEPEKIVSPKLFKDIAELEVDKKEKIQAVAGGHDDHVMAYLFFRYALVYGQWFRDRYGMTPIPSSSNIKTTSSSADIQKIERLIDSMNAFDKMEANRNLDIGFFGDMHPLDRAGEDGNNREAEVHNRMLDVLSWNRDDFN